MTYADLLLTLNFDTHFSSLTTMQKKGLVNIAAKKLFDCIKDTDICRPFYACGNEILNLNATSEITFNACADFLNATSEITFNACADFLNATSEITFNACADYLNATSEIAFNACADLS